MGHDLFDGAVGKVERAQKPVAVLFLHRALGMAQRQRADDFLAQRQHMAVRVGAHAKQHQDRAHEKAHQRHDRRQRRNQPADRAGDAGGGGFGGGDGIGLGQHLGEDQDQRRHHQRRDGHPVCPEQPRQKRCRERGGQDIGHVVAQQDRPDQLFAVLGHLQRPLRPAAALVGLCTQLAPRCRRQRRLRAGEEGRQHQQAQDRCGGDPEGGIEHLKPGHGGKSLGFRPLWGAVALVASQPSSRASG